MEREEDNDALPIPPAAFEFIQAAEEHLSVTPKVPQVSPLADDEELRRAMQYPPFERLPRVFVPRRPMTLRPPRFHYGWPINVPKLLALAEAHGLTVTRSSDRVASGPENDDTGYGEYWYEPVASFVTRPLGPDEDDVYLNADGEHVEKGTEGAVLWQDELKRGTRLSEYDIDEHRSWVNGLLTVMSYLDEEEHLPFDFSRFQVAHHLNSGGGRTQIMSMFTNHHLPHHNVPSIEALKQFGEILGGSGEAHWYIDRDHFQWRR